MESEQRVFVAFKHLDASGAPTRDTDLARAVYDYLSSKGLPVFLCTISLQKLGAAEYKRAIDAALDAANVLVAVGTSAENLESEWVRYEWDSFLNDILSGIKKDGRVFAYVDGVDPRSLPRGLRQIEVFTHGHDSLERLYQFITSPAVLAHGHANTDSSPNQLTEEGAGQSTAGGIPEARSADEVIRDTVEEIGRLVAYLRDETGYRRPHIDLFCNTLLCRGSLVLITAPGQGYSHVVKKLVQGLSLSLFHYSVTRFTTAQDLVGPKLMLSTKASGGLAAATEPSPLLSSDVAFIDEVDKLSSPVANLLVDLLDVSPSGGVPDSRQGTLQSFVFRVTFPAERLNATPILERVAMKLVVSA